MRTVKIALSLVMTLCLTLAVTPVVAGGAKTQPDVSTDRISLPAEQSVRDLGAEEPTGFRRDGQTALADVTSEQAPEPQPDYVPGEVLVKYTDESAVSAAVQSRVHSRAGGTPERAVGANSTLQVVEVAEGTSVAEGVAAYEAQPEVEWAQPNYLYELADDVPNDMMFGWQDGQYNIGQTGGTSDADIDTPAAWDYFTGDPDIIVAVIDTGIDPGHPDLSGNLWTNTGEIPANSIDDDSNGYVDDTYGWDFVNDDKDPIDDHSHGTHVSGIVGAVGDNSRGVSGVIQDVSIMTLKGFDQDGNQGSSAALVDAIDYASDHGADVINASWGDYGPVDNAIRSAIASSPALFVAAAGNHQQDTDTTPFYPASYDLDNIIAVAASNNKDGLASDFSNYGATTVDVAAPGENILSTVPRQSYAGEIPFVDPGWGDIFYDDFQTTGAWTTSDYNTKRWALSNEHQPESFSGAPSIANRWYANNEEAYLDLKYPIDLSSSSSATVVFDIRADLEYGYDFLVPIASIDGGNTWSAVEDVAYTGSTGGVWETDYLNLEYGVDNNGNRVDYLGQKNVRLSFVLVSDSADNAEGVYIDDVEIMSFGGYGQISGTSMAAPHVAGLGALLKAYAPSLETDDIKELILDTVDTKSALSGTCVTGGRVNAGKAIAAAPQLVERLAGPDRFTTAVEIARGGYDPDGDHSWSGEGTTAVDAVIIASGDDRAAADPLAASGLSWAYDAPLLLVSASFTPNDVKRAVNEIAAQNAGKVDVYIVGGPVSVPDARYNDIASYVGWSELSKHRVAGNDRYSTAAAIARKMRSSGKPTTDTVLVANGADSTKFFDALALSPIAARNGTPIIPVSATSVPAASSSILKEIGPSRVIIGGGPATVTWGVKNSIKNITGANPEQWYGNDRYKTATAIATNAVGETWLSPNPVGVAAKLPDALTGGSVVGTKNGVLLITASSSLTPTTGSWISSHKAEIDKAYVFGGEKSVYPSVKKEIDTRLR